MILLDSTDGSLQTAINSAISAMTSANAGLSVTAQFVMVDNQLQDQQRKDYGQCR